MTVKVERLEGRGESFHHLSPPGIVTTLPASKEIKGTYRN